MKYYWVGFDFFIFKLLISFFISNNSTSENEKLEILLIAFIIKILGCLENFSNIESIGSLKFSPSFMLLLGSVIPRDDAAWPKYVFNISATSVSSTIIFFVPLY